MKDENVLAKWLNNELEGKELQEFMASSEFSTYNRIKESSAQLVVPEGDMDALYARIQENKNRPKVKKLNPWLPRIAAMLVLAIGAAFFIYTNQSTNQIALNGSRTAFLLPDNSQVVLNAGSEADYKTWNWKNNRKLQLDGEAYFKVAKGQTFDVETATGTVTVVGTQFNVKARDGRFDVTCFEGKVRVASNGVTVLLLPGESIAFDNGKRIAMPAEKALEPGWLAYDVKFNSERLENIVNEIERQYNVTIQLQENLKNKPYTGSIPMNDLNKALDLITTANQLTSEKAGNSIILSANK